MTVKKKTTTRKKATKKKATKKVAKKNETMGGIKTEKTPQGARRLVGRPTLYHEDFCEIAVECMSKGFSKEAVAGHLHVSKQTLYDWMKKHPEFLDAIKIGEELSRNFWEGIAIDYKTFTQKSGKRIEATTWIFNMKNRFGWVDKQEVKVEDDTPKDKPQRRFAFDLSESPADLHARGGDKPEE